jgi:hypothetical protein
VLKTVKLLERKEQVIPGHYEPEGARPFKQHWVREYKRVWYESSIRVVQDGQVYFAKIEHNEYEIDMYRGNRDDIAQYDSLRLHHMVLTEIKKQLFQGV